MRIKDSILKEIEELDAKIEKINYDLAGVNNRKEQMEKEKFDIQKETDDLEKKKKEILAKTDNMGRIRKILYIIFASKQALKEIDLINKKLEEKRTEKDKIQGKIDVQNKLYAESVSEKEKCIEQRRELYKSETQDSNYNQNTEENNQSAQMKDLALIYDVACKYRSSPLMSNIIKYIEMKFKESSKQDANQEKNNNTLQEEQEEVEA